MVDRDEFNRYWLTRQRERGFGSMLTDEEMLAHPERKDDEFHAWQAGRAASPQAPAGQQAEPTELVARIRSAIRGHETWRVMNDAEDGFCMEFASPEYLSPQRACERWMAEQNPEWLARNGYHAVKSFEYTGAERLAIEAADALARHPSEPAPAGQAVVIRALTMARHALVNLRINKSAESLALANALDEALAGQQSERPAPAGQAVGALKALVSAINWRAAVLTSGNDDKIEFADAQLWKAVDEAQKVLASQAGRPAVKEAK